MAEWDIGFTVTAVIRMDVRNPNDKLVFRVNRFLNGPKLSYDISLLNRSQISSYFNVMAITGKASLVIDNDFGAVQRLMVGKNQSEKVYELELLAKNKSSNSVESKIDNFRIQTDYVHHPALTVAFMKLSDAKITSLDPADAPRVGPLFIATFDAS